MRARVRSWWQQIKQRQVTILVVAIILVIAIALIIVGYRFDWTGFNGNNQVTITRTISGTNAGTVTRTEEYQPGKGLWDWLGLLGVLAIPVVVGLGAAWFTTKQTQASEAANKRQHDTELEISTDNQREAALQAYIDNISELLLDKNLREPAENNEVREEVRNIARVRTLTILSRLDDVRKRTVLQFLHESRLIEKDKNVINLNGANLRGANLRGVILSGAYLRGANLRGANLSEAYLRGANLSGANLSEANMSEADLMGVNLSRADQWKANPKLAPGLERLARAAITYSEGFNLIGANLNKVNLSEATLSEATLRRADLSGADLSGVNLSGADLRGVNLSEAIVTTEQLEKAKSLQGATMPDGSIHP